jgi:hypothetical protein
MSKTKDRTWFVCRQWADSMVLKYEGCRRYLLDTIREDPMKIEHACYRLERAKDDHRRGNAEARERVVPL